MIPEPFTYAVAGFGILITLVNTVAGTLETFKARKDTFSGFANKLEQLGDELALCKLELEACLKKWTDEDDTMMDETDYLELLGTEHFRFLKRQLSHIIKALLQSQQEMRDGLHRVDPSTSIHTGDVECFIDDKEQLHADSVYCDAWSWITGVDRENVFAVNKRHEWTKRAKRLLKPHSKLMMRLEYTFWNGEAIGKRVKTLKDAIDRLHRFTSLVDEHVPNLCMDSGSAPFSKRLACAVRLNKHWQKFSSVMSTISQGPFSVIPRCPDEEGHVDCFRLENEITASVLVEERDGKGDPKRRQVVYVAHSMSSTLPEEVLLEKIKSGSCKGKSTVLEICREVEAWS